MGEGLEPKVKILCPKSVSTWRCAEKTSASQACNRRVLVGNFCSLVGHAVSDLTVPKFGLQTFCSRDEQVIVQTTG